MIYRRTPLLSIQSVSPTFKRPVWIPVTTFVPNDANVPLPPSPAQPSVISHHCPPTMPSSPTISIYYQNVRGLRTKTREIFINSQKLPYDIFALTETNLIPSINDNELFSTDFNIFRVDVHIKPSGPVGRGVLLAVRSCFSASLFKTSDSSTFEFVCVKIPLNNCTLYLLCCYVRPSQPVSTYKYVTETITSLLDSTGACDEFLIFGDFNLPHLQWYLSEDDSFFIPRNTTTEIESLIIDCFTASGLFQVSGIVNYLNKQLDLIFSIDPSNSLVVESPHLLSSLDSYHPPLLSPHTAPDYI